MSSGTGIREGEACPPWSRPVCWERAGVPDTSGSPPRLRCPPDARLRCRSRPPPSSSLRPVVAFTVLLVDASPPVLRLCEWPLTGAGLYLLRRVCHMASAREAVLDRKGLAGSPGCDLRALGAPGVKSGSLDRLFPLGAPGRHGQSDERHVAPAGTRAPREPPRGAPGHGRPAGHHAAFRGVSSQSRCLRASS